MKEVPFYWSNNGFKLYVCNYVLLSWCFIVFNIQRKQWCIYNIFIHDDSHWIICIKSHNDNLKFNEYMFRKSKNVARDWPNQPWRPLDRILPQKLFLTTKLSLSNSLFQKIFLSDCGTPPAKQTLITIQLKKMSCLLMMFMNQYIILKL